MHDPTFMAMETAEAPEVVTRMLDSNRQVLAEFAKLYRGCGPSHLVTCARGSSDHAATYLKYVAEITLGVPCCSMGASIVSIYGTALHLRDTLLVTISQSGASPDILAFQAEARRAGVATIAITNDETSPLARDATLCLPLHAGPELSVAATKTFIASAALAAAMVAACSGDGPLGDAVCRLPEDLAVAATLRWQAVEDVASGARSMYVLGRGPTLAVAQEAALKLKETSGLHAEAYSAAEVMHGPMELIEPGFPVLALSASDAAAKTVAAASTQLEQAGALVMRPAHHATEHPLLDPVSIAQTFYGSVERIARARGRDPDAPRLLRKVTKTT